MLSDQPNPGESIFLPISVLGNYVLFYEGGLKTDLAMLPLSDDICVLFEGLSKRWGKPTGEQEVAIDIQKTLKVEIWKEYLTMWNTQEYSGNTGKEDVTMWILRQGWVDATDSRGDRRPVAKSCRMISIARVRS